MTIDDMTQEDFNKIIAEIKTDNPNLYQIISDFVDKKLTSEEVKAFIAMTAEGKQQYVKNYQARA